jgi:PAB-dependent poly(A)-specific ribonuclease subunit 2
VHVLQSSVPDALDVPFNGFDGQPIELPDPLEPLPQITWTDKTPLSSIGMPYFTTPLFSAFGGWDSSTVPAAEQVIPPQILQSMKTVDGVGYASLPKELRGMRNVLYKAQVDKGEAGRFRSDRRGNVCLVLSQLNMMANHIDTEEPRSGDTS